MRFAAPVRWQPDPNLGLWERHLDGLQKIEQLLKSKGAGKTCWAISPNSGLDGKELEIGPALDGIGWEGAILSFIPGKLAYYGGEHETLLLSR